MQSYVSNPEIIHALFMTVARERTQRFVKSTFTYYSWNQPARMIAKFKSHKLKHIDRKWKIEWC